MVIKKHFPYRGGTQVFSNRYHFSGGTPSDNSHWNTLFDAIVAAEKLIFFSDTVIEEAVAYAAGSTVSLHSKSYSTAGTYTIGTNEAQAGDVAALVRYATAARTSKGHPIYLFNYYHRVFTDPSASDQLATSQKGVMETYSTAWLTGFSDGVNTYVRSGPNGADATSRIVETYVTHRDFPR